MLAGKWATIESSHLVCIWSVCLLEDSWLWMPSIFVVEWKSVYSYGSSTWWIFARLVSYMNRQAGKRTCKTVKICGIPSHHGRSAHWVMGFLFMSGEGDSIAWISTFSGGSGQVAYQLCWTPPGLFCYSRFHAHSQTRRQQDHTCGGHD